jgi:hypothetical protein
MLHSNMGVDPLLRCTVYRAVHGRTDYRGFFFAILFYTNLNAALHESDRYHMQGSI